MSIVDGGVLARVAANSGELWTTVYGGEGGVSGRKQKIQKEKSHERRQFPYVVTPLLQRRRPTRSVLLIISGSGGWPSLSPIQQG